MSLLEVKDVNQYYGGSHILRNVNLSAALGQVTVVLGRNGVGKTTLLKSLMGLVPIKSGSITLDGVAIEKTMPYERARMGVGFVPQGREIFGRLTVEENLQMGLAYKKAAHPFPPNCLNCSRCSNKCWAGAAAICPAANNSNWPLPARWPLAPSC